MFFRSDGLTQLREIRRPHRLRANWRFFLGFSRLLLVSLLSFGFLFHFGSLFREEFGLFLNRFFNDLVTLFKLMFIKHLGTFSESEVAVGSVGKGHLFRILQSFLYSHAVDVSQGLDYVDFSISRIRQLILGHLFVGKSLQPVLFEHTRVDLSLTRRSPGAAIGFDHGFIRRIL